MASKQILDALRGLMTAFERRVRSECTAEQLKQQPWRCAEFVSAELIARGEKVIENRTWPTPYRGMLAIHAGKSLAWLDDQSDKDRYVFGAVVAIAELTGCQRLDDLPDHLQDHEHANGPWCWILENVRRIEPVPFRGAQGLFDIPDQVIHPSAAVSGESQKDKS